MSRPHQYTPLPPNHIRVVTIRAAPRDGPLRLSIESYNLDDRPRYAAVSYCWGDQPPSIRCTCEPDSYINITETLSDILEKYKRETEDIMLWADQICIDQSKSEDKEQQVRLMSRIYSTAYIVVVWLGHADEDARLVWKVIEDIGKQRDAYIARHPEANDIHQHLTLSEAQQPEWVALRKFFSKPWFTRTWTFQEFVLAKDLIFVCGDLYIVWKRLFTICASIHRYDHEHKAHLSRLKGKLNSLSFMAACASHRSALERSTPVNARPNSVYGRIGCLRLDNLLKWAMSREAKLPHDKVYGLLGVATDIGIDAFPIQYARLAHEVFSYVTKYLIRQHDDLSILQLVRIGSISTGSLTPLASWVPDFRLADHPQPSRQKASPAFVLHGNNRLYRATDLSATRPEIDWTSTLRLPGVFIGRISRLSDPSRNGQDNMVIGSNVLSGGSWRLLAATCATGRSYDMTGEDIDRAFARARVWDYYAYIPGQSLFDVIENQKYRPRGDLDVSEPSLSHISMGSTGQSSPQAVEDERTSWRILCNTTNQKLFTTGTGYFGICHETCVVGDNIWLLMGGDRPYILRDLDTGLKQFKGEAYVHGIMDGEYLVKHFKKDDPKAVDMSDDDWLDSLEHDIPFPTEDVVLI